MKLTMSRSQTSGQGKRGKKETVTFSTLFQLILTDAELNLVEHYKLGERRVATRIFQGVEISVATVNELVAGLRLTRWDVIELLDSEEKIVDGCRNLKGLLKLSADFGSDSALDFESSQEEERQPEGAVGI